MAVSSGSQQRRHLLTYAVALKLTPLRVANVPPPMAFCTVSLEHKPTDVAFSKSGTRLAVLSDNHLAVYGLDVTTRPITRPALLWQSDVLEGQSARHVTFIDDEQLYVLADNWIDDESSLWRSEGQNLLPQGPIMDAGGVSLLASDVEYKSLYLQLQSGALLQVDTNEAASDLPPQTTLTQKFPAFAADFKVIDIDGQVGDLCLMIMIVVDTRRKSLLASPRAVFSLLTSVYLSATALRSWSHLLTLFSQLHNIF
jgi:elongator complex protein 1